MDSGCTRTVCGDLWLNAYLDSLSSHERKTVHTEKSLCNFRFGDGITHQSTRAIYLPVHIGTMSATLIVQVVSCNVPLLMSRQSLKKAGADLDFKTDTLTIFEQTVPLEITESGHYCLSLSRSINNPHSPATQKILFTSILEGCTQDNTECLKRALKLHKQFAHPSSTKLKKLIHDAGIVDHPIFDSIDKVTQDCSICKRYKQTPPRPAVAFPLASTFNDTVAMDLKFIHSKIILHMIDHATRYSQACVIPNKKKETIVKAILDHWISMFGSPKKFLSDNGGEFVNADFLELAEKFNIKVLTTAAESPWSNGLCEKHNHILGDMILKTMQDSHCDLELAVQWSVAAKNTLSNVYGFSPNQLVFGKNPNFPSVHTDMPPAQNEETNNEYISQTLQALNNARQSFVRQEANERLRRALNHKTRTSNFFNINDSVYYKRNDSKEWHGPAIILGKDAQQYLLKHGGIYIRVHPCRLQLVNEITTDESSDTTVSANDTPPNESKPVAPVTNTLSELSDEEDTNIVQPNPPDTPQSLPPVPDEEHIRHNENQNQNRSRIPLSLRRLRAFNTSPSRSEASDTVHFTNEVVTEDIFFNTDGVRFQSAKLEELNKWRDMKAYDEVPDLGQPRISSRWVCTEKLKGGHTVLKARLVARGFEENNPQIKTDSPTCQKESLRILLTVLASHNWTLKSLDIKSAYLQGTPINRELYIQPPKEAQTNKLWKLLKCPYGISDAGRHWYNRIVTELKKLNGSQLKLDQAVFVWHDSNGMLCGIIGVHVDDFLYGGTHDFEQNVISKLRSIFQVGLEESSGLIYIGLQISQGNHGINLSTDKYTESLKEVCTDLDPTKLKKELKHVSGQLNWIATQSRPDIAFDNCIIGNSVSQANVKDIQYANKAIRKLKSQEVSLLFKNNFNFLKSHIVGFCDASFANLPDRGSQGAFIVFLCDDRGNSNVISWQSRRIRRTVNSTLAAECLAAVEAAEACINLRYTLKEITGKKHASDSDFPISIMCDNRSLVDAVHSTTTVQNKWLQIDICVLRDMIRNTEIQEFRWITTQLQVANALTKAGTSSQYLLSILRKHLIFQDRNGNFM